MFLRVYVLPKARKMEVVPSQIHLDASSSKPIALPLSPEDVNRRGPNGRTPLMLLARNTMKLDRQLIEDANKLHSAGADLNLCDDSEFVGFASFFGLTITACYRFY